MKDKISNALDHSVEVGEKAVPTFVVAIAALFLVGATSAAVLDNFGTVAGDANVEQAVQLEATDGSPAQTITAFDGPTNIVGQATGATQTFQLDVNTDQDLDVSFDLSDTDARSFYDETETNGFWVEVDTSGSGEWQTLDLTDGSGSVQLSEGEYEVRTNVDFPLNYDVTAGSGSVQNVNFDVVIDATEAAN